LCSSVTRGIRYVFKDVLLKMKYLILISILALISSCSKNDTSQESDVTLAISQLLEATGDEEVSNRLFIPTEYDHSKRERIIKQFIAYTSNTKPFPVIQSVEVKGIWAKVDVKLDTQRGITISAIFLNDKWRGFWDPAGTMFWGKQDWLTKLDPDDMKDYNDLIKQTIKMENKAQ